MAKARRIFHQHGASLQSDMHHLEPLLAGCLAAGSGRFKYAMLVRVTAASSHPSRPAVFKTSTSSDFRGAQFRSIFSYSHRIALLDCWPQDRSEQTATGCTWQPVAGLLESQVHEHHALKNGKQGDKHE
jgi:hypothetical protein